VAAAFAVVSGVTLSPADKRSVAKAGWKRCARHRLLTRDCDDGTLSEDVTLSEEQGR